MRTNVVIDDRLMRAAMKASGLPTKRAVVEAALGLLVEVKGRRGSAACAAPSSGRET